MPGKIGKQFHFKDQIIENHFMPFRYDLSGQKMLGNKLCFRPYNVTKYIFINLLLVNVIVLKLYNNTAHDL